MNPAVLVIVVVVILMVLIGLGFVFSRNRQGSVTDDRQQALKIQKQQQWGQKAKAPASQLPQQGPPGGMRGNP